MNVGVAQERIAFTGGIATLASANGAHFLGTDTPNIVIGADSTGADHNIFLDKPLTDNPTDGFASATYHVGVGSATTSTPVQTSGTVHGYAAGAVEMSPGSLQGGDQLFNGLGSKSSNDVTINFDAARNTLSATLITHVHDGGGGQDTGSQCGDGCGDQTGLVPQTDQHQDKGGMTLVLGDPNPNSISGRSAFIDNSHYAAIETPGLSTIQSGSGNNTLVGQPTGYLVSSEQLGADGPNGVLLFPLNNDGKLVDEQGNLIPKGGQAVMTHQAFCQSCDFLKWGAWGARAGFQNTTSGGGDNVNVDVHLGWWVAGNVVGDLPTGGSASYAGHTIGTVANNIDGGGWVTYVATGDMDMSWNFGSRSGQLNITHFDTPNTGGLHFGGAMSAPGSSEPETPSLERSLGRFRGLTVTWETSPAMPMAHLWGRPNCRVTCRAIQTALSAIGTSVMGTEATVTVPMAPPASSRAPT